MNASPVGRIDELLAAELSGIRGARGHGAVHEMMVRGATTVRCSVGHLSAGCVAGSSRVAGGVLPARIASSASGVCLGGIFFRTAASDGHVDGLSVTVWEHVEGHGRASSVDSLDEGVLL